jgi:hypothetical protein
VLVDDENDEDDEDMDDKMVGVSVDEETRFICDSCVRISV